MAASRSAESPEKTKERQEKDAQAKAASRSAESPEKTKERQEKDAIFSQKETHNKALPLAIAKPKQEASKKPIAKPSQKPIKNSS